MEKHRQEVILITLSIRDLKQFEIDSSNEGLSQVAIDKFNIKPIKKGTLLMSFKLTLGKLAFAGCDLYTNEAIASLPIKKEFKDELTKKFLYYSLQYIDLEKEVDNAVKGKTLNKTKLNNLDIPIPPLKEQQKIVKILDTSLGKIDKVIALVNQNIEKLKKLNASVLDEIFRTNNWREDNLENLTTKIGSGSTPRGGRNAYKETGISLVRSMNVHDNGFRVKGLAFIDDVQAKKLSNVTIEENDVLLNITGASVARCCIIPKKYIPARVNQHVSILRCKKNKLLPEFLHLCLISPYYKNKLLISSGGGATREAITKTSLVRFKIKLPSIGQQEEIVKYLANTRSKNQNLIQHYQNKLQSLQDLKKSVLDSAFKGKLKREIVKVVKEANLPFYQMQLIGLSIQANKQDNIPQGEMAIAKDMYLLDRLYGVNTKMNFVNHSWGPFAPEIKKRVTNKQYFGRKNFINSKATYLDTVNEELLLGKVDKDIEQQVFKGLQDLNAKLFLKITKYRRAEVKELLATILKCIEDTQTVEIPVIREAMQNWAIKQGQYKTKAEKFTEADTQKMLQFIVREKFHLKVIK